MNPERLQERPLPQLSRAAQAAKPSDIRSAYIAYQQRPDVKEVNPLRLEIGNVSRQMHPGLQERLKKIDASNNPLNTGVLPYTGTVGTDMARQGLLNILKVEGFDTEGLNVQITEGGTGAMEVMIQACCEPGEDGRPLMLVDPYYTNYGDIAKKLGVRTESVGRTLQDDGKFSIPNLDDLQRRIHETNAGALVVIPYDNPSGQFLTQEVMNDIARICVEENIWMVSDEAYRGLVYTGEDPSSIWGVSEEQVPGIRGRRLSIESVSKVLNACGARIGGLVTDNKDLHEKGVYLTTSKLCPSTFGQYAIEALAAESPESFAKWLDTLRDYYKHEIGKITSGLKGKMPDLIVSSPDAALYTVVDFRKMEPEMNAGDFMRFCATKGKVEDVPVRGKPGTLLMAPMAGSYKNPENGRTQMRIAAVEDPNEMSKTAELCAKLFSQYQEVLHG